MASGRLHETKETANLGLTVLTVTTDKMKLGVQCLNYDYQACRKGTNITVRRSVSVEDKQGCFPSGQSPSCLFEFKDLLLEWNIQLFSGLDSTFNNHGSVFKYTNRKPGYGL